MDIIIGLVVVGAIVYFVFFNKKETASVAVTVKEVPPVVSS
jgi:hypothetical protein